MNKLFRPEVLKAKRDTWLGRVQDIQPIPIRIICIASFILTILVGLYIYFGGYTRRVHAIGNMMPISGLVTIGSRASGIITQKNIEEGQTVKKGDTLFIISLDNISVGGPTQQHINDLLKQQKDLLSKQITLKQKDSPIEKTNIENTIINLQKQHNKVTIQIENDNKIIPVIQQSLTMIEKAKKLSLATNQEYQSQLFSYAQILGTHAQFLQNQTSIEGQILENVSKLRLYDSKHQQEIDDIKKQIVQIKQQIIESEKQQIIYITSPIDGKVTALRGYVGQQVDPNTSLASIIPKDDELDAEMYVPSSDIGFLHEGQPVLLKYFSFPYQKFGLIKGKIVEITYSPVTATAMGREATSDTLKNEFANKNNSEVDQTLYRIRIRPDQNYVMGRDKKYYLQPGMKVSADIAVDYRRLYQWMLKPAIQINDTIKSRLMKQKP